MELYKKRISDLGRIVTGKTPRTSNAQNYGGDIPFLTPSDDLSGKFAPKTVKTITETGLSEVKNCLLPSKSVCVSCIGSDLGKVVITNEPTVTNQQFNSIIPTDENDTDFIYYLMTIVGKHLNFLSKTSTAVPIINKSTFSDYEIKVPSLENQRRIAKVLSSLDDKIETNRRINDNFYYAFFEVMLIWLLTSHENDNLEQQALAIFDKMFPAIASGEDTIGSMITPKRGKGLLSKDAVEGNVPVVAGGLEPATYHNESNTIAPVVTISASGANAGYVNLWHIPVWSSDSSFIDATMTSNVYFWYVMLKKRQKEIFDAQTGSAQPHIYPKHVAEMPLGKFEQSEVETFTEIVTPMFEIRGKNLKESERLAAVRDSLLPKLMSGELNLDKVNV